MFWQLDGLAGRGAVWGGAEVLDWPAYGEAQIAGYGRGQYGWRRNSRARSTTSALSIQDGVGLTPLVIRPTAPVRMPVAGGFGRRTELGSPGRREFALPGAMPPEEQSIRSTPSGPRSSASATDWSRSHPPWIQSVAEMRRKSDALGPDAPDGCDNFANKPRAIFE